ncbi:hypothetical protein TVAG_390300 [Trichomonas vaginalis G3]|uniref:Uncharacterized protein n=1 Tax=Trichomonas vaginalis (strain ATCC PRA-98 / G3) TaxID=412133 RepID=A2EST4_TRIV3|nr:microspherule protein 1 family [Trichomonas vaginalis G3]EAY04260.1 hypothetical protein TVAG_390300 [Trichomonas vaginalis G3]KAI5549353.1 microspherule protein 1 family [Trichomonas vaginalis G3]|eukprot:XP_001316483.1 hypothetical protein [Trichomonas vaginalis G3]
MSSEEAENTNTKTETPTDDKKLYILLLSKLITSMPVDHLKNVYQNFISKESKSQVSLEQCEELYKKLLYEPNFAKEIIQNPDFKKKTIKSVQPTKEEEFYVYLVKKFYGSACLKELTTNLRSHLLFHHSDQQIKKIYESVSSLDSTKLSMLLVSYAYQLANDEASCINEKFTKEELEEAGVSQELYDWWKQSINIPEEHSTQAELNTNLIPDSKIETIEKSLEFLTQSSHPYFGIISSLEKDYIVKSKHYLIYDENIEDTDLLLTEVPEFTKPPNGNYGALIMFKKDLEFYLENVGSETIIVDAIDVLPGETIYLKDNAVIEFGEPALVFKINWVFVNNVRSSMAGTPNAL